MSEPDAPAAETRPTDPLEEGTSDIVEALSRIRGWGEARDWRGWDPYDGLNSPVARLLSLGTPLGRRIAAQAVKASPVNVRPLIGIRPAWNQKAIGLVASGYAYLGAIGDSNAELAARRWGDWLVAGQVGGESGFAWGYHFDVQTRFFAYPAGSPNTIATTFVAHGLLDMAERLEAPQRELVEVDGLVTGAATAVPTAQHGLQEQHRLRQCQAGRGAFGSSRCSVRKAWAQLTSAVWWWKPR